MKNASLVFTLLSLCLMISGFLSADALYTPPVDLGGASGQLFCFILNTSNSTIIVTVSVIDALTGDVLATGAMQVAAHAANGASGPLGGFQYCKFDVPNKLKVRAEGQLMLNGTQPILIAPAN